MILTYHAREPADFGIGLSSALPVSPENWRLEKIRPRVFNGLAGILFHILAIKKFIGDRKSAEGAGDKLPRDRLPGLRCVANFVNGLTPSMLGAAKMLSSARVCGLNLEHAARFRILRVLWPITMSKRSVGGLPSCMPAWRKASWRSWLPRQARSLMRRARFWSGNWREGNWRSRFRSARRLPRLSLLAP